ncbi:PIN domain-containing protein [Mycobacterium tuberculosis]|uniref:PIN domain-containing protein n=1 Tax=Mycobacterium tuberculosis TaxID=1773 RepID=UPI00096A3DA7|nr:PIN domain-containing protein [Mycobacterium tuberculosis]
MILIDTSAWVEYFRATGSIAAVEVRRLLSEEAARIAMCEPIAMEILSGALDDNTHTTLERLGARIVHRDADFDVIARITNLQAASFR